MKSRYVYVLDEAAIVQLNAAKNRERNYLFRVFISLAENPHLEGDKVEFTTSQRPIQVKKFGDWLLTYWPDHGAKELRIVDIFRLEP